MPKKAVPRCASNNVRMYIENYSSVGYAQYWQTQAGYFYREAWEKDGTHYPVKRISGNAFISALERHYDF